MSSLSSILRFFVSFTAVDGGGHNLVGNGDQYWVSSLSYDTYVHSDDQQDGQGINGGVTKPDPMLRINMGGTFSNLQLVNSPGRAIAIGGSSLTVTNVHVNNGMIPTPLH